MSAAALRKLALGNGFKWQDWHLKLADALSRTLGENQAALTVFGIFGTAEMRDAFSWLGEFPGAKYLELADMIKRRKAEPYLPSLARALGVPVHLAAVKPLRVVMKDEDFERECRARIDRLKVKPSNKGVDL